MDAAAVSCSVVEVRGREAGLVSVMVRVSRIEHKEYDVVCDDQPLIYSVLFGVSAHLHFGVSGNEYLT